MYDDATGARVGVGVGAGAGTGICVSKTTVEPSLDLVVRNKSCSNYALVLFFKFFTLFKLINNIFAQIN